MPSDNGRAWPYRFELVPLDQLIVDEAYQRPLSSFAEEIKRDYNPALIGTLIVAERKSRAKRPTYSLVDGQSRAYGMRANDETVAPCVVYEGLSQKEEARLFADLQTKRRGMATYLRFRAALVAGDGDASAIAALVRQQGFKMAGDGDNSGIRSIAGIEWLYRRGPELLGRTLTVVREAWPEHAPPEGTQIQDERTRSEILRGIGRFLIERNADDAKLIRRLQTVSPSQLRHRANALREGSGSSGNWDMYVRDALIGIYRR